jgi:hypothetical protein
MQATVLYGRLGLERLCLEAVVARICLDYLEVVVKELLLYYPPSEVRAALERRLRAAPPESRARVGRVFLKYCAPTRAGGSM